MRKKDMVSDITRQIRSKVCFEAFLVCKSYKRYYLGKPYIKSLGWKILGNQSKFCKWSERAQNRYKKCRILKSILCIYAKYMGR